MGCVCQSLIKKLLTLLTYLLTLRWGVSHTGSSSPSSSILCILHVELQVLHVVLDDVDPSLSLSSVVHLRLFLTDVTHSSSLQLRALLFLLSPASLLPLRHQNSDCDRLSRGAALFVDQRWTQQYSGARPGRCISGLCKPQSPAVNRRQHGPVWLSVCRHYCLCSIQDQAASSVSIGYNGQNLPFQEFHAEQFHIGLRLWTFLSPRV